jgi:hypothetical protein
MNTAATVPPYGGDVTDEVTPASPSARTRSIVRQRGQQVKIDFPQLPAKFVCKIA